jgi:DNA polymerase/3'-5' exonuclease PolX
MDNHAVAAVLAQTASLLEIRGDNPFKIRAYQSAGETITALPEALVHLDEQALRALPGVGKDLAQANQAIANTGTCDWAVGVCRRAWATPGYILNTLLLNASRPALTRNGRSRS